MHLKTVIATTLLTLAAILAAGAAPSARAAARCAQDTVRTQTLGEATATAFRVEHRADRDAYAITRRDALKYPTLMQLLDKLPGVRYNALDESVLIRQSAAIAYQVDGVDKSLEQVKAIPPAAIASIELVHTPAGKYAAEGVRYVVNIVTRKERTGLDLLLSNFAMLSPNGHNGDHPLRNEQPNAAMQYTAERWNVNAGYTYANIHTDNALWYTKTLPDGSRLETPYVSPHHPNERNAYQGHVARLGADFKPNAAHSLSFNTLYKYEQTARQTAYTVSHALPDGTATRADERDEDSRYSHEWRTSLAWHATPAERWRIEATVNYNRLWSDSHSLYAWAADPAALTAYRYGKDYVTQTLSAQFAPTPAWLIDFGMANTYNRYTTRDRAAGTAATAQASYRGRLYLFATRHLNSRLTARAGLAANYVTDEGRRRTLLQPSASLIYHPEGILAANISYTLEPSYPMQYQLTPAAVALDRFLIQQGNPNLRPLSYSHDLTATASLWDNLTLTGYLGYSPNSIQDDYARAGQGRVLSTFTNARLLQNVWALDYTWQLSDRLAWTNSLSANYYKAKGNGMKRDAFNWGLTSDLQFFNPGTNTMVQLTYNRLLMRTPRLQGYNETGQDTWQLTAQQLFCHNTLSVALTYLPPIRWGVRSSQRSLIDTPAYRAASSFGLRGYENMLLLRVTWQLHRGKRTNKVTDRTQYDNESRAGRGLM